FFGFPFLHIADDGICEHSRQDHSGIDVVTKEQRRDHRCKQEVDQRVVELREKADERVRSRTLGQFVWPMFLQAARSFLFRQSAASTSEGIEHLVDLPGVPGQLRAIFTGWVPAVRNTIHWMSRVGYRRRKRCRALSVYREATRRSLRPIRPPRVCLRSRTPAPSAA